jgi:uncharacterized protein (TIGR02453 family)
MPPSPWLTSIREKISDEPKRFRQIIASADFVKYFKQIDGDKLKKAPKGYPSDHPEIEFLKYKSVLVVNEITDKFLISSAFHDHVINTARAMKPFNDFLNEY